jgi:hypothetical protein
VALISIALPAYGWLGITMSLKKCARNLSVVLILLPSLALDGQCDQFNIGPGGDVCTTEVVPSVVLAITDGNGDAVSSASIVFAIDGTQTFEGSCDGDCGQVVLAYEAVGQFDIAVRAPGYLRADESVVVELDEAECHPVTEDVDFALERDTTVGALAGAWSTTNFFGTTTLRFDDDGTIIGAILYDRTAGGDGNFYIVYNGQSIRGAPGQQVFADGAPEPTRNGNFFDFRATTLGIPVGFENATLSSDFSRLTGMLQGVTATYTRLLDIPDPLLD